MGVNRPTLYLYRTPALNVKKAEDEVLFSVDPKDQAEILCAILISAVPNSVSRAFINMIGGDYDRLFDIGNSYVLNCNKPNPIMWDSEAKKYFSMARLSDDQIREIRSSDATLSELAQRYKVTVANLRRIKNRQSYKEVN